MSATRIIEISSTSRESFEDAIRHGISRASSSQRRVQSASVKEQIVSVENGRISGYRVDLAITLVPRTNEDMGTRA